METSQIEGVKYIWLIECGRRSWRTASPLAGPRVRALDLRSAERAHAIQDGQKHFPEVHSRNKHIF